MLSNLTHPSGAGLKQPEPERVMHVNPLEGHDVALYVDGKRISVTYANIATIPGDIAVSVYFETTIEAATNPTVNAFESQAWNGFRPMDHVGVRIGAMPQSGVMLIEHIIMPDTEAGEARFKGRALTPIYNLMTGVQIAAAEDECTIPVSQAVRISATGPQL